MDYLIKNAVFYTWYLMSFSNYLYFIEIYEFSINS